MASTSVRGLMVLPNSCRTMFNISSAVPSSTTISVYVGGKEIEILPDAFNLSSPSGGSDICLAVAASGDALTGGKLTFGILPGDKADLDVEFWILGDVSLETLPLLGV